jgi:hypothetical protein
VVSGRQGSDLGLIWLGGLDLGSIWACRALAVHVWGNSVSAGSAARGHSGPGGSSGGSFLVLRSAHCPSLVTDALDHTAWLEVGGR